MRHEDLDWDRYYVYYFFCSFGDYYFGGAQMMDLIGTVEGGVQVDTNNGRRLPEQQHDLMQQQVQSRQQFALHAMSAIAFQAALCFLEPSLKSIH